MWPALAYIARPIDRVDESRIEPAVGAPDTAAASANHRNVVRHGAGCAAATDGRSTGAVSVTGVPRIGNPRRDRRRDAHELAVIRKQRPRRQVREPAFNIACAQRLRLHCGWRPTSAPSAAPATAHDTPTASTRRLVASRGRCRGEPSPRPPGRRQSRLQFGAALPARQSRFQTARAAIAVRAAPVR